MCRVLEDVPHGHRGVREAVDEERFELALEEVQGHHGASEGLQGRGIGRAIAIDVRSEEIEEWVNDERSGIFDQEDGLPGYLGA